MPVFLRWLLIEMIVKRVLRHPRVRGEFNNRVAPMMSQYTQRYGPMVSQYSRRYGRFGRRFPPMVAGGARFVRRRPGLGCCSGCLAMVAAMVLGLILMSVFVHWALSL